MEKDLRHKVSSKGPKINYYILFSSVNMKENDISNQIIYFLKSIVMKLSL